MHKKYFTGVQMSLSDGNMGKREVYKGFWWGCLRERDYFEDPGVDGRIILKRVFFKKLDGEAWAGLLWLRIGTAGGLDGTIILKRIFKKWDGEAWAGLNCSGSG